MYHNCDYLKEKMEIRKYTECTRCEKYAINYPTYSILYNI